MSSMGLNREYPLGMAPVKSEDPNASSINASVLAALAKRQYTQDMFQSFKLMAAAAATSYGLAPSFLTPDLLHQAWKYPMVPMSPPQESPAIPKPENNNNNKIVDNNIVGDVVSSTVAENKRARKKGEPKKAENKRASSGSDSGKDKQFQCTMCPRSFGYKHVLQNHQRTHTGEKPFKCQLCDKRFTRDHHLKTHIRLHTGERPYECRFCDKRFVQVANLRRHERVHTGERPFKCKFPICQLQFSDSNQLKAHTLTHTKEKPFECERCNVRFRRKHHLLQHKCGCAVEDPHTSDFSDDEIKGEPKEVSSPLPGLTTSITYPEQTEPEDLSMSTGRHSNTSGDSPFSRSPSSREDPEEGYLSDSSAASSFLRRPY